MFVNQGGIGCAHGGVMIVIVLLLAAWPSSAWAQDNPDAKYIARFQEHFKKTDPAPAFSDYATAPRFDEKYLGDNHEKALQNVSNDQGNIAWGLAYWMMSYNEMYRATHDTKYLSANLDCIRAVMAARDDKRGTKLWTGKIAPAWSSDKYAERGRAVFAVHTGMIVYPMLDFLLLAKEDAKLVASLGDEFQTIQSCGEETLAYHDRQWRDGPEEGAGHYIGMDQENVLENKPLPGNRLSAMGRALWTSWKLTGNTTHRDHARALGRYIKDRLTSAPDGAYYWGYWLAADPVKEPAPRESISGEDTSHAGLTIVLPLMLASEGEVFTAEDMTRLGNTVLKGFGRLHDGILFGDITGLATSDPRLVAIPAKWLQLSQYAAEVREPIVAFYLNYVPSPGPLDLALLVRYAAK